MKKNKKILSLLLAMVMVVGLATSCGLPSTSEEEPGKVDTGKVDTGKDDVKDNEKDSSDEQITLRIIDWSDSASSIRKKFNDEYMVNNPNVKIEYTMLTIDQFKSSVITAIKSGDAPDLFPIPSGMSLSAAIQEDWYQAMNEYIPDAFWDTINEGALVEGVAKIGDSYYSLPEVMSITNSLIYYNQDVLDAAGVTELPTTYSEFIAVNKQVTEAGNGEFYGFIEGGKQLNRLQMLANAFANVAGGQIPQVGKALTVNGRINYDSEAMVGAFELFNQLYKDGSIHPDTVNLGAPEAREYFAQGEAAFLMQGNWCISTWDEAYPDMKYGVMGVPAPDSGAKGAIANEEVAPWMGIYSKSKYPQAAADYLMALYNYTEGYTYQKDLVASAGQLSIVKGMVEENLSNPHAVEYYNVAQEVSLQIPSATAREPKVYDFYAEVVDVQPGIAALFQGILSGSLDNYKSALTTLSDAMTEEWKRASEVIGIDFSTFEFTDWDPTVDYIK